MEQVDEPRWRLQSMAWLLSVSQQPHDAGRDWRVRRHDHAVSQRTREMAFAWRSRQPVSDVGLDSGEGLAQVGLGLIVGTMLSLLTARLSAAAVWLSALSLTPYVIVVTMLARGVVIACAVPARRAMRIDRR